MDSLIDPQQAYNKTESSLKDYLIRFVGHGWVYEQGAIDPNKMAEWESRAIGVNREYAKGRNKPEPDTPPAIGREIFMEKTDHRDTMRLISATPMNLQGETQTSNEASSLFTQRVQQAGLMQSTYLDALKRADIYLGKHAVDGIQKHMTLEREIRILNDDGDPEWILMNEQTLLGVKNDVSIGKYDIKLDETSYSVTARVESFMQGMGLAKMLADAGRPDLIPFHLIVKNSDIPDKALWVQWIQAHLGIVPGMPGAPGMPGQPGGAPPGAGQPGGVDPRTMLAQQLLHHILAGGNGAAPTQRGMITGREKVSANTH